MSGARTIRLLLADVDGTLLTKDKVLTGAAKEAARELRHAGIVFAITSGLCRRAPLPIATRTRVSPKRCGSSFCGRPPHDPRARAPPNADALARVAARGQERGD
jgi:haloacid dehalogenase-like hydrolase